MVRERATGREVTKAMGNRTRKWAATDRARANALWQLKRELVKKGLKGRYVMSEYELVFVNL